MIYKRQALISFWVITQWTVYFSGEYKYFFFNTVENLCSAEVISMLPLMGRCHHSSGAHFSAARHHGKIFVSVCPARCFAAPEGFAWRVVHPHQAFQFHLSVNTCSQSAITSLNPTTTKTFIQDFIYFKIETLSLWQKSIFCHILLHSPYRTTRCDLYI